ncbi:MAG: ubiquinol oxidase subunit II [Candidatus Saccharimonadales bacterium]
MVKRKLLRTPWRVAIFCTLILAIVILGGILLLHGKNIAVLNPQGVIADKQMALIVFTVLLGLVVIIPVFVMLFGIAWKYREDNPKKQKYTPDVEGNRFMEGIWWGIPVVIILILSIVTWISTHDLDPYKKLTSDKQAITIRVVALQWKWLFIYPGQGVASVNEVRFPEDTPVNFEVTADAPMSAFWIPNLGSQIYAMNGMTTKLSLQANNIGEYRGSNTNISGEGYSKMNFKAVVTSREEFDQWVHNVADSDSHLMWDTYEELAKPSQDTPVTYYHLHDPRIFGKVLAKYMSHGAAGMDDSGSDMMEENHEYEHEGMTQ